MFLVQDMRKQEQPQDSPQIENEQNQNILQSPLFKQEEHQQKLPKKINHKIEEEQDSLFSCRWCPCRFSSQQYYDHIQKVHGMTVQDQVQHKVYKHQVQEQEQEIQDQQPSQNKKDSDYEYNRAQESVQQKIKKKNIIKKNNLQKKQSINKQKRRQSYNKDKSQRIQRQLLINQIEHGPTLQRTRRRTSILRQKQEKARKQKQKEQEERKQSIQNTITVQNIIHQQNAFMVSKREMQPQPSEGMASIGLHQEKKQRYAPRKSKIESNIYNQKIKYNLPNEHKEDEKGPNKKVPVDALDSLTKKNQEQNFLTKQKQGEQQVPRIRKNQKRSKLKAEQKQARKNKQSQNKQAKDEEN